MPEVHEFRDEVRELIRAIEERSDEEFQRAVRRLAEFSPDIRPVQFTLEYVREHERWADDISDEEMEERLDRANSAPFFSEAYLYRLVGKSDARTILAYMRDMFRAAGLERSEHG